MKIHTYRIFDFLLIMFVGGVSLSILNNIFQINQIITYIFFGIIILLSIYYSTGNNLVFEFKKEEIFCKGQTFKISDIKQISTGYESSGTDTVKSIKVTLNNGQYQTFEYLFYNTSFKKTKNYIKLNYPDKFVEETFYE